MLNLHAPFRLAAPDDGSALADLLPGTMPSAIGPNTVVAGEGGRLVAALSGHPDGETWRIDLLAVTPERRADLMPRLLAVADALASDEGLASVVFDDPGDEVLRALLDQEGFRPTGQGGRLARDVIPQG